MTGRKLKGKTIAKVHQALYAVGEGRGSNWGIVAIEFTDGSFLRFLTIETDGEYGTAGVYPARPIEPGECESSRAPKSIEQEWTT